MLSAANGVPSANAERVVKSNVNTPVHKPQLASITVLVLLTVLIGALLSIGSVGGFNPFSKSNGKRVALCISGDSHAFHRPTVHQSILHHVVAPLRDSRYHVDVIMNMRLPQEQVKTHETRKAMLKLSPVVAHEIQDDRESFVSIHNDSSKGFPLAMNLSSGLLSKPRYCTSSNTRFDSCSIPFSLHYHSQCRTRINEYEHSTGLMYDYVYWIRPNIFFFENIIMPSSLKKGIVYTNRAPNASTSGFRDWWNMTSSTTNSKASKRRFQLDSISDQVLAARREEADLAMQAVKTLRDCNFYNVDGLRNAQAQLAYWLLTNGLQYQSSPWLSVAAHIDNGLNCQKFGDAWRNINGTMRKLSEVCDQVSAANH